MTIAVVASEAFKEELLAQGLKSDIKAEWLNKPANVPGAACYIDLLFSSGHSEELLKLQPALIIVNSVPDTTASLPENFIRINGWNTFLKRPIVEAACSDIPARIKAEEIFAAFNKTIEWVPDIPGFITPRVVATVINEAYFTLEEKVSSKEEIDIAMKLGTNYPYGPFEWSKKIGLKKIFDLLTLLAKTNTRYEPSPLLQKEALL